MQQTNAINGHLNGYIAYIVIDLFKLL